MHGEMDGLTTLEKSSHMVSFKEEVSHLFKVLMIETKDTITHTQT
jgi:hypothetical protein